MWPSSSSGGRWLHGMGVAVLVPLVLAAVPAAASELSVMPGAQTGSVEASQEGVGECERIPGFRDRCPAWISEGFVSADGKSTFGHRMAVSPDGESVFVAVVSEGGLLQVAAYRADTGSIVWSSVAEVPDPLDAYPGRVPESLAVSPDGSRVYVVGSSWTSVGTLAGPVSTIPIVMSFDAVSGEQLWSATFDEPAVLSTAKMQGFAETVAVSPDGRHVYVGGYTYRPEAGATGLSTGIGVAQVLAYDAESGAIVWRSDHARTARIVGYGGSFVYGMALAPDGSRVYAQILENDSLTSLPVDLVEYWTGIDDPLERATGEFSVVAYDTATGEDVWDYHHIVPGWRTSPDFAGRGLAVSPDGSQIVAGGSVRKSAVLNEPADGVIVVLDAAGGQKVWERRHFESQPCGEPQTFVIFGEMGRILGFGPDGVHVYTAGRTCDGNRDAVVVYEMDTGKMVRSFVTPNSQFVMSPDAAQLYGAGLWDGMLAAYYPATSDRPWVTSTGAQRAGVGVSPDSNVFYFLRTDSDHHLMAYHTGAAEISLTLTESSDPATVGQPITYTFTMAAHGPDAVWGARLAAQLPDGVRLVSADPSRGTCTGTATVTCELGDLDSGQTATVQVVVVPESPGTIVITGSVSTRSHDPNLDNNHVSEDTSVEAA